MFRTAPVRGPSILQCLVAAALSAASSPAVAQSTAGVRAPAETSASARTGVNASAIDDGRDTFRFDTFGDEAFWSGALQLHKAIEGAALGGVGSGVSPRTALAVGLKVDSDALPASLIDGIRAGKVNLDDPATTVALLDLNAVVGVRGVANRADGLSSIGISCALCHSVVDDSVAPGIGKRRDGWANRDLNVGAIVGLSPDLSSVAKLLGVSEPAVRAVLAGWGPGKFDAEVFLDGKGFRPDGKTAAVLIPPAFGLAGVNLHTWTGWGSITQWNAFVAVLEMHGQGTYLDARLDDAATFPVAARNQSGHTRSDPDLVTSKLGGLQQYQLSLQVPLPAAGSFDGPAAERGRRLFEGAASCSRCHVVPLFTEPGWNMHTGAEIGIDEFQASRSPDKRYRTSPLRGLTSHQRGGYYHDGRFPTLDAVVDHYDATFHLGLRREQRRDLVEYLKSL
jgi:hypothetical protein